MSLSVYDPVKNCFVLKTMTPTTVNAFHPDFMKTYYPNFMKEFRTHEANREIAKAASKKVKKTPLKMVTRSMQIRTKQQQSMSMAEVRDEVDRKLQARLELETKKKLILSNREIKYFSAAGTANVTAKGKKK